MRILQIIDSLEAGGAERMAVNYANGLASKIEFSGIVVTRNEGALKHQLNDNVGYCYIEKKGKFDFIAILKLRNFVKNNKIEIVHAHSTSFFIAFLLKLIYPSVQLIWHDHYGDSEFLSKRPRIALRITIPFFKGIIAVNQDLKTWAQEKLKSKNVVYLPNFPSEEIGISNQTILKGINGKRIVCLANLRLQKNHFFLLRVAQKLKESYPDWTFHLVGKDFEDDYSNQVFNLIRKLKLEENVYSYGTKQDIKNILNQSEIAILTSSSEGLPLALLEYGLHAKPVIVTNVGEIPNLIKNEINGYIVNVDDDQVFYDALLKLISNEDLRNKMSSSLFDLINKNFSQESVLEDYISWLEESSELSLS